MILSSSAIIFSLFKPLDNSLLILFRSREKNLSIFSNLSEKIRLKMRFITITIAIEIDKSLINFNLLNDKEKSYLDKYHRKVYFKLSPFLNKNEKNWLKSFVS